MDKVKIGSVVQFCRGVSYKKEQARKTNADGFIAILRANNIEANKLNFDDLVYVPSDLVQENQYISNGDIIITMSSGSKAHVGKVAIAQKKLNCSFGAFCGKLIPKDVVPKYLFYILQSNLFRKHIEHQCKGTNINNIRQSYILDYEISLPSIAEQERIVARIEELFSQLDASVNELKAAKERLKVYRQAVLKEAFEGDYPRIQLKEISNAISGYAFKSKLYTATGKYVVVKIGNVKERYLDFSRDLTCTNETDGTILDKYLLQCGDCLITLTGSRGKRDYGFVTMITDQTNYLLNQRVAAIRFDREKALPEFFQYYLASPAYRDVFFSYETGNVGQGNVGIKALTEPTVILPDIEQQRQIVEKIESHLSVCDSIEKTVGTALQQAETLRQSILMIAFEIK
ncbi:MAG: hypothetical protein HDT16_10475 [Oscillibacter sp.]|nr:hypothetical protein [Oscillibacter sp.]